MFIGHLSLSVITQSNPETIPPIVKPDVNGTKAQLSCSLETTRGAALVQLLRVAYPFTAVTSLATHRPCGTSSSGEGAGDMTCGKSKGTQTAEVFSLLLSTPGAALASGVVIGGCRFQIKDSALVAENIILNCLSTLYNTVLVTCFRPTESRKSAAPLNFTPIFFKIFSTFATFHHQL